ncbi:MAG: macro domain-containing protein [Bacteroidota bacterium]
MIQLTLVDPKLDLCNYWEEEFQEFPEVEVVCGYFESIKDFDCMVSAANSFGLMDGGVDLAIINFFGEELEKRVQRYIIENYFGEQPVGTSFLIDTKNEKHPFIAHTPTMRTPMAITGTDYVYLAMKAILEIVWKHNTADSSQKIEKILCPGLGTATGRMPPKEAARQMKLAYKNFKSPPQSIDWRYAAKRQQEIKYGGNLGHKFSR